jgi:hypothetical protein
MALVVHADGNGLFLPFFSLDRLVIGLRNVALNLHGLIIYEPRRVVLALGIRIGSHGFLQRLSFLANCIDLSMRTHETFCEGFNPAPRSSLIYANQSRLCQCVFARFSFNLFARRLLVKRKVSA